MALSAAQQWWIRTDGDELNGGGYDATVSGAGTNYSDQAAAQLSLTDVVTVGTTAVTSVTGGFTTAMIGNIIRIAGDGYYAIVSRTNTNTIGVDRNTGTATGQSARIGGAWAGFVNASNGGGGPSPLLASPVATGHTINVRGTGSLDGSADYTYTDYWTFPSASSGYIDVIGYNGRPCLSLNGLFFFLTSYWRWTDIKFLAAGTPFGQIMNSCVGAIFDGCIYDQAGYDVSWVSEFQSCVNSYVKNTGSTSSGTAPILVASGFPSIVKGCQFIGTRGVAIKSTGGLVVTDTLITDCSSTIGLWIDTCANGYSVDIDRVTIDGGALDGIYLGSSLTHNVSISNSQITNNGGYGIENQTGVSLESLGRVLLDYNNFYGNTSGALNNITAGAHDTAVDPGYIGSGDYTPTNALVKGVGFPGTINGATNYVTLGAINPVPSGGGGGMLYTPGLAGGMDG